MDVQITGSADRGEPEPSEHVNARDAFGRTGVRDCHPGEVRTLIRHDHHIARQHACVALAFLDLY
jgi:hypothetical protein